LHINVNMQPDMATLDNRPRLANIAERALHLSTRRN